jgi:medium-chain acyl-[acyl-carrier-protein] hydrolase
VPRWPNRQAAQRLFCLPYAGAGGAVFREFRNAFAHSIEVCPVTPPGRLTRISEPLARTMSDLVTATVEGLKPFLDLPFTLFGYSLGATVAFEIARELRRSGGPMPRQLVIAARRAPQLIPPTFACFAQTIRGDGEFLDAVREHYGGLGGAPMNDSDIIEMFAPVLRADMGLIESYSYTAEAPLDVPIIAFGGTADRATPLVDLEAWGQQTTRGFRMSTLPAGHFFMHEARASLVEELAIALAASTP